MKHILRHFFALIATGLPALLAADWELANVPGAWEQKGPVPVANFTKQPAEAPSQGF